MRFDKLTIKAQEAIQDAQNVATRFQHSTLDVEHLLLALLEQNGGTTNALLEKIGIDATRSFRRYPGRTMEWPKRYAAAANSSGMNAECTGL